MTVEEFSQSSQLTASLIIFGLIFFLVTAIFIWSRILKGMAAKGQSFSSILQRKEMRRLFIFWRYLVASLGIATLVFTILPGLLRPFGIYADPNLGLGGIVLFILWPLLLLQVALGVFPWEKYVSRGPLLLWGALIAVSVIAAGIDLSALRLMFIDG